MSTTVTVDVSELMTLAAQMQGAAPIVAAEFEVAMNRATIIVQSDARSNIRQQGAIDTGGLLNSVQRKVEPFESSVGTNLLHGKTIEFGWPARYRWIPQGALLGWLARHGIPAEAEDPIRRRIYFRGFKARPWLYPALENNRRDIDNEFEAAQQRIVKWLVA